MGAAALDTYDDVDLGPVVAEVVDDWANLLAQSMVKAGFDESAAADAALVAISAIEGAIMISRVKRSTDPIDLAVDLVVPLMPEPKNWGGTRRRSVARKITDPAARAARPQSHPTSKRRSGRSGFRAGYSGRMARFSPLEWPVIRQLRSVTNSGAVLPSSRHFQSPRGPGWSRPIVSSRRPSFCAVGCGQKVYVRTSASSPSG